MSEFTAAQIIKQILSAIIYYNSKKIVHRDLKLDNILLEKNDINSNIKIIDFGSAKMLRKNQCLNDLVGTPYYVAPEVLQKQYNEKCDIWSCGIIMYVLLCGNYPFNGSTNEEIMKNIKEGKICFSSKIWKYISKQGKNLLKKMLTLNPNKRISCTEAINDPWFKIYESEKQVHNEMISQCLLNLRKFRAYDNFQRAILTLMANRFLSKEEENKYRNIFNILDQNHDGILSKKEIQDGMINNGYSQEETKIEMEKIIKYIDLNNNGYLDYSEFLMANLRDKDLYGDDKLHLVFDYFDPEKKGIIEVKQLGEMLQQRFEGESAKKILQSSLLNKKDEVTLLDIF